MNTLTMQDEEREKTTHETRSNVLLGDDQPEESRETFLNVNPFFFAVGKLNKRN
jgi:hypothetical protein